MKKDNHSWADLSWLYYILGGGTISIFSGIGFHIHIICGIPVLLVGGTLMGYGFAKIYGGK